MSSEPKTPEIGENSGGGAVAVERAVTSAVELPLLTRGNYHEWSLVMKVSLEELGLWRAVETEFSVCRVYVSTGTLRSFDRRRLNPPVVVT